jgi:hypothetical protein
MDCIVLSLSDHGAALQPEDTLNLPEKFELEIKFGDHHPCHVRWVHGNKLGVRFLDA